MSHDKEPNSALSLTQDMPSGERIAVVIGSTRPKRICPGGGVSLTKNAEARLRAAFDTSQCDDRASSQTEQKERANFLSILRTDLKLPRVAKLVSDAHAEDRLRSAIRKAAETPGYKPGALKNDYAAAYRLRVKFYADEKALDFHCITPPQKPVGG